MSDFEISIAALDQEVKNPQRMLASLRYWMDKVIGATGSVLEVTDDGAGERWEDGAGSSPLQFGDDGSISAGHLRAGQVDIDAVPITSAGSAIAVPSLLVGEGWLTEIGDDEADEIFCDAAGNIKVAYYPERVFIDGFETEDAAINLVDERYTAWIENGVNLYVDGVGVLKIASAGGGATFRACDLRYDRLRWIVDRGAGPIREEELLIFPSSIDADVTSLAVRLQNGQSVGAGVANDNIVTSASPKPGYIMTMSPGVRLLGNSHNGPDGAGVLLQRETLIGLTNAREQLQGSSGETGLVRYGQRVSDRLGNAWAVLVGTTAISGQKYEQWGVPGQAIFENLMTALRRARVQAAALGLAIDAKYTHLVGGESDKLKTRSAYQAQLLQYQADVTAGYNAIVPGTGDVVVVLNQFSSWTRGDTGLAYSAAPLAQLHVALENPTKFVCIGPIFHLPYDSDGIHLSPIGQFWRGEIAAEYENRHATGGNALPLHFSSSTLVGNVWTGTVAGLDGNLVIDTTAVTDPGNYGVTFVPNVGNTAAIVGVALSGTDKVTVTFSAPPSGTLRFALDGTPNSDAGATTGPRNCFRDSAVFCVSNDDAGTLHRKWLSHDEFAL